MGFFSIVDLGCSFDGSDPADIVVELAITEEEGFPPLAHLPSVGEREARFPFSAVVF